MSGIIGSAGSKSGIIGTTELDYEEGAWTPTNNGLSNITLTGASTGTYVKVGKLVTVHAICTYSDTSGSHGFAIGGLPFIAHDLSNTSLENGGIFSYWQGHDANMSALYPYVNSDGAYIRVYQVASGGANPQTSMESDSYTHLTLPTTPYV